MSVMQRPPIVPAASIRAKRLPAAARRRPAAMPAVPAPTMMTSSMPAGGSCLGAGAPFFGVGAPSAGAAVAAAPAARNERRLHRVMGVRRSRQDRRLQHCPNRARAANAYFADLSGLPAGTRPPINVAVTEWYTAAQQPAMQEADQLFGCSRLHGAHPTA